jgi:hypothetical protein
MRGRTVYRETGRKENRGRKKREGREVKRGGRKEKRDGRMDKHTPRPPPLLWYSIFAVNS